MSWFTIMDYADYRDRANKRKKRWATNIEKHQEEELLTEEQRELLKNGDKGL